MVDYSSFYHHRWYWVSNFASGDIANQTAHDVDIIRWGLGLDTHPNLMMSLGGRYLPAEDDDADTPNCQTLVCQWEGRNLQVSFEIRHWFTNSEAGMGEKYPFLDGGSVVGVIFFGSEGYMIIPDYSSYYVFLGAGRELGPHAASTKPQLPRDMSGMVKFHHGLAPFPELDRRLPQPQARGPQRRRGAGPPLHGDVPLGENLQSPQAIGAVSIPRANVSSTTRRPTSCSNANTGAVRGAGPGVIGARIRYCGNTRRLAGGLARRENAVDLRLHGGQARRLNGISTTNFRRHP